MRLFISVDIPEKFSNNIKDLQEELDRTQANLNLVDPTKTHITLKFLGETDESRLKEIKKILEDVVSSESKFQTEVQGVGAFPSPEYIKVLWIGVSKGSENLISIHKKIEKEVVKKKLAEKEDHKFTPHITIARMKGGRGKKEVQNFLNINEKKEIGKFEVSEIRLKKSTLTNTGPEYETLHKAELN